MEKDSDVTFDTYRTIAPFLHVQKAINNPELEQPGIFDHVEASFSAFRESIDGFRNLLLNPQIIHSMLVTFDRPWFHRIWTAQELILARQFVFMCETRTLTEYELKACAGEQGRVLGLPTVNLDVSTQ
jgi:hypothetical protein